VKGIIYVNNGASLVIKEGAAFSFADNKYITVGESGEGTIMAQGTAEDSIIFKNLSTATLWGYGTSGTSSGGIWIDDGATAECALSYCIIDSATSGIHVEKAAVSISNCRISNNQFYGIYFDDGGHPVDSASFIENVISGNGEYGIGIYSNFLGTLSGTGSVDGNTKGGIFVVQDAVETDGIWKKHDAAYVVAGTHHIGAGSGATVTIRPGCRFELKDNAYIAVGESKEGTLIAEGTETDSIVFTNYSSGTMWGYGTSASSSGGIWIDDKSTDNTSLKYCVIEKATSGIHVEYSGIAVSNCRISDNEFHGIHFDTDGYPLDSASFVDNIVTSNGEYGVSIYSNYVGNLSGTGSFSGNTNGGILVVQDDITTDAVWKKHDVPYVVKGTQRIGADGGVTVTIRPGAQFELQDNAYIAVGESKEATLIANGTEQDSIVFTNYSSGTKWGYGTSATSSGGIWIDDFSTTNTSVQFCLINNATTGIHVKDSEPTIMHCHISDCQFYGIYLHNAATASISDNTFANNQTDTGTN
jgi:parallel beta-helix repeat protein